MRIFTPGEELPMAGHPVIGSTFALAHEGVIAPGRQEFVYELGVGPTPVSLQWQGSELAFAWMTQKLPEFGATIGDRAALAAAMGLREGDLGPAPAEVISCGVPFLIVGVHDKNKVDEVAIDRKALVRCLEAAGSKELPVFFFAPEAIPDARIGPARMYSRMLAPGFGIAEDPATGSASGPLGCYLLRHGLLTPEQARAIVSHQGVAMKRPSQIHISIESENGSIARVRVGGQSVLAGRGELHI
jgi:trans-2,3-dihydro-3-hydroxyanthranilate isomerase